MRIPFCPFPLRKAKTVAKKFYPIVDKLATRKLDQQLKDAGIDIDERTYMGIAFFSALYMFAIIFAVIFIISIFLSSPIKAISISLPLGLVMFFVTIFYIKKYPKLLVKKKTRNIERNLIHALRHIFVQIKSGVTLFDALISVSQGNYGEASKEFGYVVKEVNTGAPVEKTLDNIALKNPSLYFRRIIWQISNGMKAGGDVGDVLKNTIENISSQQRIAIRKYGSQLNPLTLVYMMVAVIMPSLGITFLIVLSTFSGISISETMFWLIMVVLVIFQFMFLGVIKSKRPSII